MAELGAIGLHQSSGFLISQQEDFIIMGDNLPLEGIGWGQKLGSNRVGTLKMWNGSSLVTMFKIYKKE